MRGTLFLEPFGGLGNRMRAIISALNLANYLNKDLKIIWRKGEDLNCDFDKLFDIPAVFQVYQYKTQTHSSYNPSFFKKVIIYLMNRLRNLDVVIHEQDLKHTFYNAKFNANSLSQFTNIYIRSCEQFYGGDNWLIFHPIEEIQRKIDRILKNFKKNTIGLHIRRTDNGNSIRYSPLDLFCKMMESEIKNDNTVVFFLATDDPETQSTLLNRFSADRIIFHEKEFSRASEKGIQDGLLDLYCLASCSKIIGSYWSSFTEVASYIHNTEMIVAKVN